MQTLDYSRRPSASPILTIQQKGQASHRLDYIDALRAFACLWVILCHAINTHQGSQHHNFFAAAIFDFISLGWLGVHLFLVLSGFCLYYPLVRRNGVSGASVDLKDFAYRRSRRILPPYYLALAIYTICNLIPSVRNGNPPLAGVYGFHDIALHLLLLQNVTAQSMDSINPAFWSLALETQLYIIFPLLVMLARKAGTGAILGLTLAISLTWQIFAQVWLKQHGIHEGIGPDLTMVLFRSLPGRCFEFAAGMFGAALVATPKPAYLITALVFAIAAAVPDTLWLLHHGRYGLLIDQGWGVVFASIVVATSFIPASKFTTGILAVMTWIGMFSYSLYLLHEPLLVLLSDFRIGLHLTGSKHIAFEALRIVVLIPIGYAYFLLVEKPFLTKKKQVSTHTLEREAALSPAP